MSDMTEKRIDQLEAAVKGFVGEDWEQGTEEWDAQAEWSDGTVLVLAGDPQNVIFDCGQHDCGREMAAAIVEMHNAFPDLLQTARRCLDMEEQIRKAADAKAAHWEERALRAEAVARNCEKERSGDVSAMHQLLDGAGVLAGDVLSVRLERLIKRESDAAANLKTVSAREAKIHADCCAKLGELANIISGQAALHETASVAIRELRRRLVRYTALERAVRRMRRCDMGDELRAALAPAPETAKPAAVEMTVSDAYKIGRCIDCAHEDQHIEAEPCKSCVLGAGLQVGPMHFVPKAAADLLRSQLAAAEKRAIEADGNAKMVGSVCSKFESDLTALQADMSAIEKVLDAAGSGNYPKLTSEYLRSIPMLAKRVLILARSRDSRQEAERRTFANLTRCPCSS